MLRALMRPWRHRPLTSALVLITLALGVGLTTAVFTLLDSTFLRPWPVVDLDELVLIHGTRRNASGEALGSHRHAFHDLEDLRRRQSTLEAIEGFHWWPMSFEGGPEPVRATGMFVTQGYFDLLGLQPTAGRLPRGGSGQAEGAEPWDGVVVSHSFWRRHLGSAPSVVGQTVRVNGQPFPVVGVGPPGFVGTELPTVVDFWLPAEAFPRVSPFRDHFEARGTSIFSAVGRLQPDRSPESVAAELETLARQLEREFPQEAEGLGYRLEPLRDAGFRPADRQRYLGYGRHLGLAVLLVLGVTWVNTAGLLLAVGLERRGELAVRASQGATRARLVAQLSAETAGLLGLGGLLALPIARWALDGLWRLRPPQIGADLLDLSLDGRALVVALLLTVLGGLVAILPSVRHAAVDPADALRPLGRGTGRSLARRWRDMGRWLAIVQVALAVLALAGAARLLVADREARAIDPGFDADRLLVASVAPGELGWDEATVRGFYRQVGEQVAALPGVESAAWSENRLLRGATWQRQIFVEGRDEPEILGTRSHHRTNVVEPGFFATVGIPLVAGQDFANELAADGVAVAILNQTLVDHAWPGLDPIGQRFRFDYPDSPLIEVVGVARDARYRHLREPRQGFVYLPLAQAYREGMTLHVRSTAAEPQTLLGSVRQTLKSLAPGLPVAEARPLAAFLRDDLWLDRVSARLVLVLAGLAWGLAAVGLLGVLSRQAIQRRQEIGIRRALGADRRSIVTLLARDGLEIFVLGSVLGWGLFFALAPSAGWMAWREVVTSPSTLWVGLLVIAAVAVPCLRALSVDPAAVLRGDR